MTDANSACSTLSTNSLTSAWPSGCRAGSKRSTSSMCCRVCSSCAAFPGMSVRTTARSSLPRRCRSGSPPSAQRPPTSPPAARGRTGSSRASTRACVTSCSTARFLHPARGPDRHRELAAPLQYHSPACLDRLLRSRTGGVRASLRRMAGRAIPTSSAGHAPAAAKTNPKLTFHSDHLVGAGQVHRSAVGKDAHWPGSASDLAEAPFDGVGGPDPFALGEGFVAPAEPAPAQAGVNSSSISSRRQATALG